MSKAKKNRDDAAVKTLLDTIAEPMAKQYTAGNLDDKTRKDLMKSLSNMRVVSRGARPSSLRRPPQPPGTP